MGTCYSSVAVWVLQGLSELLFRIGAAMSHYKSNLRDLEFNLFEVLRRQDLLGREPYPELDEETARGILDEVNRLAIGPPEQQRFAQQAIDRKWGSTMVLTEPEAGSDVGAGRTRAVEQPDGTWH